MSALGISESAAFAAQAVRVERDLLWAHQHGMDVPPYVLRAFRDAVALARLRSESRMAR